MKKALCVLCSILIASTMITAAFAAQADPSPAVTPTQVVEFVIKDAEGNVLKKVVVTEENKDEAAGYLKLTPLAEAQDEEVETPQEVKDALEAACEAMEEAESMEELIPEYAGKEVLDIIHVSFSEEIAGILEQGGSADVTTDLKLKLEVATRLPIIRYIDEEWVDSPDEYAEILEDGSVMLHLNQPGVFAVLIDPDTEILTEEEEAQ